MKLLSVIVTMDPASGGPAQGIRNNIPFWEQQGIFPTVLSFDEPDSKFLLTGYMVGLGAAKNSWSYNSKAKRWLLENLHLYDVVLIHGLWQYHSFVLTQAIQELRRLGDNIPKVFVMPHGMLDPYFQKAPERRLKAIRNSIYWSLIEKKVVNKADGVLFTCEEELQLATTTFSDYKPKTTYNVGYGIVPPPQYSNNQTVAFHETCAAVVNRPFFLFLSRIHQKKGVDILLKSYVSVYDHCLDNGIVIPDLVIAGPGMDTDYGDSLKFLQEQYPILKGKVHYPGMLQGDAKWGALYGAELFVLPSHQENFGIAIVEAMACKTPVLITNRVNIWQEIAQGEGGIVTDDSLESVQSALQTWVSMTASDKATMGNKAYDTYESHFTAEATSRKFISVIKNV